MASRFYEPLDRLARVSGNVSPRNWSDEHDRLELYRHALTARADDDGLRAALIVEPEPLVVSDIITRVLEDPEREDGAWMAIAPDAVADFLSARQREIRLRDEVAATGADRDALVEEVLAASDWLQLSLAEDATSPRLLEILATKGRTKRIRRASGERLRALTGRGR